MRLLGFITFAIISGICGPLWNGYVLKTCWNWFNSEYDLPALSLKFAMFTFVIVRYLTAHQDPTEDTRSTSDQLGSALAFEYFVPALVLFICYCIQRFA